MSIADASWRQPLNVILIQIPLMADQKSAWDKMIRSSEGVELTVRQKGFISAEFGYSTDVDGNLTWNALEKWETKEDFVNYNSIPERQEGSDFIHTSRSVMAGAPVLLWLDDVTAYNPEKA